MKTLLISFVLIAVICLTNGISVAAAPPEITSTFSQNRGTIVEFFEMMSEHGKVYVGIINFGDYYIVSFMRNKDGVWKFNDADMLEIFILHDDKPLTIWTKSPPNPT